MTIESLPENVLLEMFCFYRLAVVRFRDCAWDWRTLAHVCRRWRHVILTSPYRLDARLVCTASTPVAEMLDVFPTFPIIIAHRHNPPPLHHTSWDLGNVFAALRCRNQACWISLSGPLLGLFVTLMQEPFPTLTFLELRSNDGFNEVVPAIPDAFLGRSAPRLEYLILQGIPFPALPRLLFSAKDLVSLHLADIPITGYMSPEALAGGLSALPRLTWLIIMFASPTPGRRGQQPGPGPRADLPSLTFLSFRGVSEYLEDLVTRISAPLLNLFHALFFDQPVFNVPQLFRFIGRSRKLRSPNRATVRFYPSFAKIALGPQEATARPRHFALRILCDESNRQISSVAQICGQSFPLLCNVERLDIKGDDDNLQPGWQGETNGTQLLDLLHPFIAVGRLHISERLVPLLLAALQGLTEERAAIVLPELHSLFLEGLLPSVSVREAIDPFISARQRSGCPVAIRWGECA